MSSSSKVSISDWLHCNKCSIRHNKGSRVSFFLSECGHIFCESCTQTIKTGKNLCLMCHKRVSIVHLNNNVEPDIMNYFQPVDNFSKKLLEVYNFQAQHQDNLYRNLEISYNNVKKEFLEKQRVMQELKKENQILKNSLRGSGGQFSGDFITGTPVSTLSMTSEHRLNQFTNSVPSSVVRSSPGGSFGSLVSVSRDGSVERNDNNYRFMGYARNKRDIREKIFDGSGDSSLQRVPMGRNLDMPRVHRSGKSPFS